MNLRLPITIRDCKPDALIKWIMLADVIKEKTKDGEPSFVEYIEFQCQLLSVFSKVSISKIKKGHIDDVQFASQQIMQMLSEYKSEDPSGEIVIDGKKYIFDLDFGNITTGQIIDLKLIEDVASDPCRALAICYVEEGMDYCHEDDKGRILNPTAKRYEIFKERFPGDEFLNYFGFFLRYYEKQSNAILAIQMLRMEMMNKKNLQDLKIQNGSFGRASYIDYQKNWDAVWKKLQDSHI